MFSEQTSGRGKIASEEERSSAPSQPGSFAFHAGATLAPSKGRAFIEFLDPLQDRGAVCATGRRLYFRNRSLAASIIKAWTVVSRSRASCRSAFNPSGLILVKMPLAATGALACAAFALPCRLRD
jgi:hypothetical protein